MAYMDHIKIAADIFRKEKPDLGEEYEPKPFFVPTILNIREKEGAEPIHKTVLWRSTEDCGERDV